MSKVLFLTDTHIGCRNSHSIIESHIAKFHSYIVDFVRENDIKTIYHLGDLFDDRKNINVKTLDLFKNVFFNPLRDMGVQFTVIVGNHDTYMRSHNEINTLNAILKSDEYPNIRVINEPTEIILDEKKFLFVPWMHNSHFGEYLTQIEQSTADILCAHLEMQGFVMHAGVMSADGLEAKTFEQFDRVLTGHYHAKSTRNNVTYLGTAYDTSWADVMDRKFFHIYDTIDDSLSPIEYNERLFVRLVYNDATQESLVIPKNLKGKFVKLIVRSKTDVLNFETRLNQITSQEPFELSVVDETVLLGDTSFEVSDSSIADTTQVINDTIDSLTDTESVDKDRLKILMQELYQDAIRDAISEE